VHGVASLQARRDAGEGTKLHAENGEGVRRDQSDAKRVECGFRVHFAAPVEVCMGAPTLRRGNYFNQCLLRTALPCEIDAFLPTNAMRLRIHALHVCLVRQPTADEETRELQDV